MPGSLAQVHFKAPSDADVRCSRVGDHLPARGNAGGHWWDNDNIAHVVPVTIGQDDGATVQIVSGLKDGDRVIQDPPDSLIEGEKVNPQKPEQTSAERAAGSGGQIAMWSVSEQRLSGFVVCAAEMRVGRSAPRERLLAAGLMGMVSLLAGCKVGPNYHRPSYGAAAGIQGGCLRVPLCRRRIPTGVRGSRLRLPTACCAANGGRFTRIRN